MHFLLCIIHICFHAAPGLLSLALTHRSVSHRASPCSMGETCFWSVTHATCWTMWNHSSVPMCDSARRPTVLSERALQAVSMLSQRANLQTAAFSIRSGFWRCVFFFLSPSVFQRGGERGVTGSGGRLGGRAADKSETCTRTRRWYGLCTRLLATKSWITQTKIYCRWRRLEEGRHGLWGKTNHKCFLN